MIKWSDFFSSAEIYLRTPLGQALAEELFGSDLTAFCAFDTFSESQREKTIALFLRVEYVLCMLAISRARFYTCNLQEGPLELFSRAYWTLSFGPR